MNRFDRTEKLIGSEALKKLNDSKVAVFGIGGVGGYTVEALARAGVGALDIIDKDIVDVTNINRQIIALSSTVGKDKVSVAADRIKDINPNCSVNAYKVFFLPENEQEFDFTKYDYVVDAVDTVSAKIAIIKKAKESNVPIISAMGAGNKLDGTCFEVADISKTSVCPLAKVVRKELKDRNIKGVKVVYSKEEPVNKGSREPASVSYVPSIMGLMIAGEVIKDLIREV